MALTSVSQYGQLRQNLLSRVKTQLHQHLEPNIKTDCSDNASHKSV